MQKDYARKDFVEIFKNLDKYRFKNNFIGWSKIII